MQTEIEVKILLDEDFRIFKTELGVNVNNSVSYEAMDYILYDTFSTLANKFKDKLNHHNHNENLN
jgi:hypothetical protein